MDYCRICTEDRVFSFNLSIRLMNKYISKVMIMGFGSNLQPTEYSVSGCVKR